MNELDERLRERILSARALPSPPVVTARLIQLCEDPDTRVNDVIDVLSTDPALAARLMRLANSSMYARRRRTENLRQAVMLLGFDVVLTASLSLMLTASRNVTETRSATFRKRRWTRSVHSAACAQLLAEQVKIVDPTDAFLAALLQDIGIQVVDRIEPETYEALDPNGTHDDLVAAELERLGVDHAALGAALLQEWRLPDAIVKTVRASHEPTDPEAPTLAAIAAVGGMIADGFVGDVDGLDLAYESAADLLGVAEADFSMMLEYLTIVLPDLSAILDAEVPDQDTLMEMAEEAIVVRQMRAQSAAAELHDEVATLRNVAEELKTQNGLDALTGLSNRRKLDEVLNDEFAAAKKNGFPLSLLFVDLDDFKKINDRFGHKVGDELLTRTARRISAAVRDGDLVGRFGGEEFLVILPGTDAEHSDVVAKRLVHAFCDEAFRFEDGLVFNQTASVGVATLDHRGEFETSSELVHAADLALYVAKRNGKNQFRRSEYSAAPPEPIPT